MWGVVMRLRRRPYEVSDTEGEAESVEDRRGSSTAGTVPREVSRASGVHVASVSLLRQILGACLVALFIGLGLTSARAWAATSYVDGISDQSLPAWDGSFSGSPFANFFRGSWAGSPPDRITFARYVVQWNALTGASKGPNAAGDYREKFEAWLEDVRSIGLTPLVALTSYNGIYPKAAHEYQARLEELLNKATAMGHPIGYVEAWNEPNNQGHESAVKAAELANAANAICETVHTCRVIAGDFEDTSTVASYEKAYESALTFSADTWGVHPYVSVKAHNDANLLSFKANLPKHGVGDQIWFTEVGAFYCKHGEVRGEGQQARDATYLVKTLIPDPSVAPAHVFYYGFLAGNHLQAPCAGGGGDDSELYARTDEPRAAASVIFGTTIARQSLAFGPNSGGDLIAFA